MMAKGRRGSCHPTMRPQPTPPEGDGTLTVRPLADRQRQALRPPPPVVGTIASYEVRSDEPCAVRALPHLLGLPNQSFLPRPDFVLSLRAEMQRLPLSSAQPLRRFAE